MSAYSIKDLERLSGIKAHTIRIWEKRYSLFEPSRTGTNRRLYSDEDLRKIINVGLLTRHGIKISHISRLTGTELDEKAAFLGRENSFTENHIDSLVIAMIDLNEDEVNDIIMKSVMNTGFEETFENKVFPFLRKIGILWQTGSVNPAQEHFITNILRKRIIIATDSLPRSRGETLKRVLLFLPDSELHDLGLLYYSYLVKKNGNEMIYLGQMMPLDSLDQLNMKWKPDIIVTGTVTYSAALTPEAYITELSSIFPGKMVLVSGLLADAAGDGSPDNIIPVRSPAELVGYLNQ